jgi:hypothetical protein
VRIYSWDGSTWNQVGNDIDGEADEDELGNGTKSLLLTVTVISNQIKMKNLS